MYEQFLAIRQEAIVHDYVTKFERMACQLSDLPGKVLKDTVVNRLKTKIRNMIRFLQPEN